MATTFRALVSQATATGFEQVIAERSLSELPAHAVQVRVHYSSLNYKDALSATGHTGITRHYPHTPGIDAAGVVTRSDDPQFAVGDQVIVTSYDLGMNTSGGLAEYIQVPAEWVVPLPQGLSLAESMLLGTAGFTAGLAVYKLQRSGQTPEQGPVVVTGATGGVGCLAVSLLAQLGYEVWAVSGKPEHYNWLKSLGAAQCLGREEVLAPAEKVLLRPRWAGAIDTVGGLTLSTLIRACGKEGNLAVCGLVQSAELPLSVYPFILNGVNLLGVDSAETAMPLRRQIWQHWAQDWRVPQLGAALQDIQLAEVPDALQSLLAGKSVGRWRVSLL